MDSPVRGWPTIDLNATAAANLWIIPVLLSSTCFDTVTGCDTVASYFGIGKGKASKDGNLLPVT